MVYKIIIVCFSILIITATLAKANFAIFTTFKPQVSISTLSNDAGTVLLTDGGGLLLTAN